MQGATSIDAEKDLIAALFSEPRADRYSKGATLEPDFSVINRAFLDGLTETGQLAQLGGGRLLLPPDYVWTENGKTRVPMALCEFVAYKASLAYEKDWTKLKAHAGNVETPEPFDTSAGDMGDAGEGGLADTQGFAFMYDGMAFIIMRGTQERTDWSTNLQDKLTHELQDADKSALMRKHGAPIIPFLDGLPTRRGRHLGFALGWAAVHDRVSAYLKTSCPPGVPVVVSGHSLGGALALIGALELKRDGHNVAAVITFGAPQAGNDDFSREYAAAGLSERTILFEAQGDTVPRILRRWYYRLHRGAQQRIMSFVAANAAAAPSSRYAVAGTPWLFDAQPALSGTEVTGAIRNIIDGRERAEKEKAKAARKTQETAPVSTASSSGPGSTAATPPAQSSGPAQETGGSGGKAGLIVVGVIVALFLVLFLWLFVRSKLSAHAIADRYALFLSTLAYQRIRFLRAQEPGNAADKLALADKDLSRYLRFIRAEDAENRPVRLHGKLYSETFSDPKNVAAFFSDPRNII